MLTCLKGACSHLCETNVHMHGGISVLSVPGMRTNSQAGLARFFSFSSLSPPRPFHKQNLPTCSSALRWQTNVSAKHMPNIH